jgi:hypothetical protein
VLCYGVPFVPSLVFLFISTPDRGKIYGNAVVSKPNRMSLRQLTDSSCGAGFLRHGTRSG